MGRDPQGGKPDEEGKRNKRAVSTTALRPEIGYFTCRGWSEKKDR